MAHPTCCETALVEADPLRALTEQFQTLKISFESTSDKPCTFDEKRVAELLKDSVRLVEKLEQEMNVYWLKMKEWHGWHFPEMRICIEDMNQYCRVIQMTGGMRCDIIECDLSEIMDEHTQKTLKSMALVSMGSDMSKDDMRNVKEISNIIVKLKHTHTRFMSQIQGIMELISPEITEQSDAITAARLFVGSSFGTR